MSRLPTTVTGRSLLILCLTAALGLAPLTIPAAPETVQELVRVLESEASLEVKADACRQVGERGSGEAVPALATLLDHEVLAAYARTALERIPDPRATAALRAALDTTEGELLAGVITSLGALRDETAVGPLGERVDHGDLAVGEAALRALGRVANPEAMELVTGALASARKGADTAALLAAEQLRAQGDADAALALYDAVRSADVSLGSRLAATRGAIVTRRSVPFLVEQLRSDDLALRNVALAVIREMPSAELADVVHGALSSAEPDLRVQLITALRDCHNYDSLRVVRAQLAGDDPQARMAALGVVSAVGRGPVLAQVLLDVIQARRSPAESQTAVELLTRMEGGPEVERAILDRLRALEEVEARVDVMRVLGDLQVQDAIGALLEQARDDPVRIRVAALRSMRRIVGPAEVAPLIALIQAEESARARSAAIRALVSACGDDGPSGKRVLAELERASAPSERDAWTRVLTAIGYRPALPLLLEGLEGEDPDGVVDTVAHLSRWPDPAPIDALFALLEGDADPAVERRAVGAVIQLTTTAAEQGQRPDDVLAAWLERVQPAVETIEEKRQLLSSLARVHSLGSLRLLEPYLGDPEVETEAGYALLSVGSALVKANQPAAVSRVLAKAPATGDQELSWRLGRLREQAQAAHSPR